MTLERTMATLELDARIDANQRKLAAKIQPFYDFIVCGSGSSGSVVARRLAETGDASVLLLEAGGTDDLPSVSEPALWYTNLKTDLDWGFEALPNHWLNGRRLPLSMGKVLGGGSSINVMNWARGHKNDWIISPKSPWSRIGAMSPSLESFAVSRTGRGLRIPFGAGRVVSCMWSRRAIRIL